MRDVDHSTETGRPFGFPTELILLPLALVLRIPGLASRPLWYDESFAVLFSSAGPQEMLYGTLAQQGGVAADVHPIGYYTLLWMWEKVLGTSPLAVRSLSLLIGLSIVFAGYRLARDMFGEPTAFIAGVLLAISPFQVHYAQEVRMYGLLTLILLLASWAFWSAIQRSGFKKWFTFGLFAGLAQYTHNLAGMYLLVLASTALWMKRRGVLVKTMLAGGIAVTMYLPWLLQLPRQLARIQRAYWIQPPGIQEIISTLLSFVSGLPLPPWGLPFALFASVFLLVLGFYALIRGWKRGKPEWERALTAAYISLGTMGLMFILSQWQPVYLIRALLPAGAVFLLWMSWTLRESTLPTGMLWTGRGVFMIATVLGLMGFYSYRGFPYAPFEEIGEFIQGSKAAGEIVVHSNKISALPMKYYHPDLRQKYLADPPNSGSDTLALPTQEVLDFYADPGIEAAALGATGVWYLVFDQEILDYQDLGFDTSPAMEWLNKQYQLVDRWRFGDLNLIYFRVPDRV